MSGKEELIKSLIKDGYLKTPRIIEAFRAIDRADFVLPEHKHEAYENHPLPIGQSQTISQPLTVAFMLELLDPKPGEKILDIGSGSGWTTALLANLVGENGRVFGIERLENICGFGQKNLKKYEFGEVAKIICADGTRGLPEGAPYDKILAGATASKDIPQAWRNQLKIGGKIVAPVGQSVFLFIKKGDTEWEEIEYPGFSFVPLIKGKEPETGSNTPEVKGKRTLHQWQKMTLFIIVGVLLFGGALANEIYFPHGSFRGAKSVEIPEGVGSGKIAGTLKKEGIIRSKWVFVLYVSLKKQGRNLRAGDYVFAKSSIPEIVRDLVRGGTNERVIVIPEGWSLKDIGEYLEREGIASSDTFKSLTNVKHSVFNRFDFLSDRPAKAGLEGYLFPDTYRIFKDAALEDIVATMLVNFDHKLTPDLRTEISKQKKSIFKIVTMASLIEKEVVSDEDKALVSGILWKRLEVGIPLQVDATIVYLTGKKTTKILAQDFKIDSPHNTYKYYGLPPGPIANPGISSIKAAIYPKDSSYFYYLSTPDGKTIFSKTLEEHNEAKAKYLR